MNTSTQVSPFRANNKRDPRMEFKMRKKRKLEGAREFMERMKKTQKEAQAVLKRAQEEMKRQVDRKKREVKEYWERDLVLLSTKDLKWQIKRR